MKWKKKIKKLITVLESPELNTHVNENIVLALKRITKPVNKLNDTIIDRVNDLLNNIDLHADIQTGSVLHCAKQLKEKLHKWDITINGKKI